MDIQNVLDRLNNTDPVMAHAVRSVVTRITADRDAYARRAMDAEAKIHNAEIEAAQRKLEAEGQKAAHYNPQEEVKFMTKDEFDAIQDPRLKYDIVMKQGVRIV